MNIRIHHRTAYSYDRPATSIIQVLRLTPRNHEGQRVRNWRIDVDHDVRLQRGEDAFGNITHALSLIHPLEALSITVEGEVETHETHGVIAGTVERFPIGLYLRQSPLTQPDADIVAFARESAGEGEVLEKLHSLLAAIHGQVQFDTTPTDVTTTAAKAFAMKRGVCQDLSHVFIAAARSLGIPARYIGGYMLRVDGIVQQDAGHAWAEAYVPDFGWVGFDPANGISPSEAHVRVSVGLDYLGAAPVRGSHQGETAERLDVTVTVDHAAPAPGGSQQHQNQQ